MNNGWKWYQVGYLKKYGRKCDIEAMAKVLKKTPEEILDKLGEIYPLPEPMMKEPESEAVPQKETISDKLFKRERTSRAYSPYQKKIIRLKTEEEQKKPFVRPPAVYTNTNWDEYKDKLLNNEL